MATRFMNGALQGGSSSLDVPVAALAGLSVAFVAFAAPAEIIAGLVRSTGLASVLSGAEPPLGLRARLGIGAAGAVLVFALAFTLLRWLERFGRRPERHIEPEPEFETPRLRRRDFHPDAAPRPPLFAARELSEPGAPQAAAVEPEIQPQPEPQPQPELPSWLAEEQEAPVEMAAEPAAREIPVAEQARPRRSVQGHSIADLLDRLEQGLARRRTEVAAPAVAPPAPAPVRNEAPEPPQVFPEAADDRLQSAIDSLQRLAARRD